MSKGATPLSWRASLVAVYAVVPRAGLNEIGETEGGFFWKVVAEPVALPEDISLLEGALQRVSVVVSWDDGPKKARGLSRFGGRWHGADAVSRQRRLLPCWK